MTCNYPGCKDDTTTGTRCEDHNGAPLPECGGCRQPATRICAFGVADVCDYCGERSDADYKAMIERDRRDAAREAYGDYLRDEGKDKP